MPEDTTEHAIGVTFLTASGEPAAYAELPTVRAFQEARALRNQLIGIPAQVFDAGGDADLVADADLT